MKQTWLLAVVLLFGASVCLSAQRPVSGSAAIYDIYGRLDETPHLETQTLRDGRFKTRAALSLFNGGEYEMELRGADARRAVIFQLSPRIEVISAKLRLRHASSAGLLPEKPHLRVDLNDFFLAQVPAMRSPSLEADEIDVPVELLRPGYNKLQIGAVQRYAYECQDPTAPELWSLVDARRSELDVIYARRPFDGTLADIPRIATSGVGGLDRLTVVTPGETPRAAHVKWGALGVEAFVNRMDGDIPEITHAAAATAEELRAGRHADADAILVGTAEELRPLIGAQAAEIAGAYLSIAPFPADAMHFLLIISGRTDEEVERAAVYLNTLDRPLPDTAATQITAADMPAKTAPSYDPPIASGAIYRLRDIGFPEISMAQQTFGRFEATFLLPADFFVVERASAVLSLDLAYGADLRKDSAVNIFLNDIFQHSIWLSEPRGAVVSHYEVRIPARRLKPGRNILRFDAVLTPVEGGSCDIRNRRHLALVIKDTSTFSFPKAAHFAELPDLQLLQETGFPYFGSESPPSELRLGDTRAETIAAAWTLVARLGRATRSSIADWTVGFGHAETNAHLLYVGVTPAFANSAGSRSSDFLDLKIELGREGALVGGKAPHTNHLYTVLTAATPERLVSNAQSLTAFSHWGQLRGGKARWRKKADTMVTIERDNKFAVGTLPQRSQIAFLNARTPWQWVLSIGGLILGLALILSIAARFLRGGDKI